MRCVFALFTLAPVTLTGCGWQRKVEFAARSSDARILLYQPFPINEAGLRIVLRQNGRDFTLLDRHADTFLEFVHVWWASDLSLVAILSCGIGETAYDLRAHKPVSYTSLKTEVAQSIRVQYALPSTMKSDKDVFLWACSSNGQAAFFQRYPSAKAF
jgi:hypothetical protein